jgi:molecular chaperone GrpE
MFFKKKGNMTDKTTHNKKSTDQDADNMAQNEEMNEALATEAATDENVHGGALVEDQYDEIEKLQGEVAELKDKLLRQVAEFDNFRRRTAKERVELIQTAGKEGK